MSVTIILPDNKQLNIKVTINTLLSEILEKVCVHKGLDSNNHTLQRNSRPLDLSLTLRLASIPLNSELNLVYDAKKKVNQQVNLSVQFEDQPRRTGLFTPGDTLWHVVKTLFAGDLPQINDESLTLSINYMNRQFEGKDTLSRTTLKLIGILSGRVLLRMTSRLKDTVCTQKFVENIKFKKPEPVQMKEAPIQEANKQVVEKPLNLSGKPEVVAPTEMTQEVKTPSPVSGPSSEKTFTQESALLKQLKNLKDGNQTSARTLRDATPLSCSAPVANLDWQKEVKYLGGQNDEILYSLEDSPKFVEESVSDDFFVHTAGDLKHLLVELKRQQVGDSNAFLETLQYREEREKMERQKYAHTIIRLVLPYDRLVLQALFKPNATVEDILTVLRKYTHPQTDSLYLFTAPPKTVLSNQCTLFDLNLVPSGLVYCGSCQNNATMIAQQFKDCLTAFPVASKLSIFQMKSIFAKSKEKKEKAL